MRSVRRVSPVLALLALCCSQRERPPVADPTKIVADMLAAAHDVTAVQYDFNVRVSGSLRASVRPAHGSVIITLAHPPGQSLRIEGVRLPLPSEKAEPERFALTSDGTTVRMISANKRAVFFSPMHRAGGLLLNSRAGRATLPFSEPSRIADIQKNRGFRSVGVEEIDGVMCDVVRGEIPNDKQSLELAAARSDCLPRRVTIRSTDGATALEITHLRKLDRFDASNLRLDAPSDYLHREYTLGGPAVGEAAPQWTLAHDGKPISLASLKGKIVILDFWATWCGPCRASMPALQHLYDTYRTRGLEIVGATWNEKGDPEALAKELGISYMHVNGDAIGGAYGIDHSGIPTMFIIDRDGRVADFFIGWNSDATQRRLNADIASLIGGTPLEPVDLHTGPRSHAGPLVRTVNSFARMTARAARAISQPSH